MRRLSPRVLWFLSSSAAFSARYNVTTIFLFRKVGKKRREALWSENICRTRSNFFLARRRQFLARTSGRKSAIFLQWGARTRPRHTKVSSINLSLKFVLLPVHVHTAWPPCVHASRVYIHIYIYIYTRVYLSRPVLLRSVRRVLA